MRTWAKRLLLAVLLVAVAYPALVTLSWVTGDEITKANMQTTWKLRAHQFSDRSKELQRWLLAYHGEAQSSAVMFTFVDWAMGHPQDAEALLAPLPDSDKAELAARMAWAVVDSSREKDFDRAFAASTSAVFISAMDRIRRRDFRP